MTTINALNEYFIVLCRGCRMGHIRADLPARPGAEGSSKCPVCGRTNPGWTIFGPFTGNHFMGIPGGPDVAEGRPLSSSPSASPARPDPARSAGGGLRVRLVVKGQAFGGVVKDQAMDGKVMVGWDDPAFQAQWGATWFPLDKLERVYRR